MVLFFFFTKKKKKKLGEEAIKIMVERKKLFTLKTDSLKGKNIQATRYLSDLSNGAFERDYLPFICPPARLSRGTEDLIQLRLAVAVDTGQV